MIKFTCMNNNDIKWIIFLIVVIGNFIAMLDSTSVNLALYNMSVDFGANIAVVQWVVIAYMLVLTVFLPFFGKLGDRLPKNKLYTAGFLIFGFGALLNITAPNLWLLIFYRCIEALGASIMLSNSTAIYTQIFKSQKLGKALGLNGGIIAIGGMSGPALGGILINYFGWRAIFIPEVPVALFAAFLAYNMLPSYISKAKKVKFDYPGFIYFVLALFALLLSISEGHRWGWHSLKITVLGIIAFGFGFLFYFRDHKINYPLINFKMFKIKAFTLGSIAVMTSYMAMFTNSVLLPFYLQEILKYTPLVTGLLTLPYAIALTITAPISGNTAGKYGSRWLTVSGPFCMVLGLLLFTLCDQNTSVIQLILASAIMGMGNGLFQSPSNMAIMSSVKKNELGIASGILALSRNMGNILGVAITITLFDSIRTHYLNFHVIYQNAFMFAYKYTMICGMGFGIICLGLAFIAYKPENKTDCHSN